MQMQAKKLSFLSLVFFTMLASLYLAGCSEPWQGTAGQQNSMSQQQNATPAVSPTAPPLDLSAGGRLIIPSAKINAPIEMVSQDAAGHMGVPQKNQWESVGLYSLGPVPGMPGSAVIDGHLDRPGGSPAVFWNLGKLHVGDKVTVKDHNGRDIHFMVTQIQNYSVTTAPLEQIFARQDGTYLNLITCAGQWDINQNQYLQRLVVYTELVK
ncbi:MAG TPA: class F sortase [Dictyobacter sp.]|nr:class F sortase [Dictyobacter sp.]